MNKEQIAKLKELAQAAENEVIRSHGWAGSVEMLETLRIDEEYLTAASPAAILELIALAERTTSPVSQMTEHKGAAQIHRSNDKGASNQGHKPLPIAKDSLLVRKVHPAPVEGTFTRGEARAAVLAVAAAAPHAQAAAPVAEQKWPESEAFKYINQKVAEQMSPAPKSAQPQPVAEQGELPELPEADWLLAGSARSEDGYTADQMHAYARAAIAASQQAAEPKRQVFIDEIDAAKAGSACMEPFFLPGFRLCYSQDEGAQAPQVKWCMLFDSLDRVIAGYMLTCDAKNWTELTLVGRSAPAIQQPQDAEDTARLDFMTSDKCIMDCNGSPDDKRYWLSWPYLYEEQGETYATPREAIDAARAALAKKGGAA